MKLSVFYEHIAEASAQTGKAVSEVCEMVHGFGIDGVDIDAARLEKEKSEIMEQLEQGRLKVNCLYAFFDFGINPDDAQGYKLIDTAGEVGAKNVLVIPGFIKSAEDRNAALENMKKALLGLCAYAKTKGIAVGMEDFDDVSAPYATADQLLWFLERIPDLKCTFDTGNFIYSEEDVLVAYNRLESYIGNVHCKDRSLEYKAGEEPKLTVKNRELYSSPVGYGCIPMEQLVKQLLQKEGDRCFTIEHFGSQHQLADMERSARWLLELEKKVVCGQH